MKAQTQKPIACAALIALALPLCAAPGDAVFFPQGEAAVREWARQAHGRKVGGTYLDTSVPGRTTRVTASPEGEIVETLIVTATSVQWLVRGPMPAYEQVSFECAPPLSREAIRLGAGTRIAGGWELRELKLANHGRITVIASAPGKMRSFGTHYWLAAPDPPAAPDTDADGLPDGWEQASFGNLTAAGPLEDVDGDGLVNLIELAFGLDPKTVDAARAPQIIIEDGYLTLTLTKRAGVAYLGQSAATPEDAAFSATTTTVLVDDATTLKVRDNFPATTAGQRFLRVKVTAAL